jgi:diguanylate cyclase (GGDEF)-like protein
MAIHRLRGPSVLPKILVVDDTAANLIAMRRLLASSNAQIFEAASGNEALALCLDHRFALILLDVNMPGMDGFEVATLLGAAEQLRDTPIIFVTAAYADDLHQLKGYRSGAVDYIAKPVNDVILQSKVRVFLDLYAARSELQQALDNLAERNRQLTMEVAERGRVEALVRHQASHDMLTDLPNRMLFHDRLQGAIQRTRRHPEHFALACIDIDGFKGVNDTHGHATGDALLRGIAARLLAHVRGNDTVARLGGDEFALILEDLEEPQLALQLGEKLCAALRAPYALQVNGQPVDVLVGASIGIATYLPDARADADEQLLQAADHAMYQAKRSGKNRCVLASGQLRPTPA